MCTCTHICAQTHEHTHAHTCTHIHAQAHAHTHIHIHAHKHATHYFLLSSQIRLPHLPIETANDVHGVLTTYTDTHLLAHAHTPHDYGFFLCQILYRKFRETTNEVKTVTITINVTTGIIPDLSTNTQYVVRVIAINGATTTNPRSAGSQQQTGTTLFGGKSSMD